LENPNILTDATKVVGSSCMQVCLPQAFEEYAPSRGIELTSTPCVYRGFNYLSSEGHSGGVAWFVFDAAPVTTAGRRFRRRLATRAMRGALDGDSRPH